MSLRTASLVLDAGVEVAGAGSMQIAGNLIVPEQAPIALLVCLPGGGMNRRYFDLLPPDGSDAYSFARQMAHRGFASLLIDPLGVGESSRPDDGYSLTPEVLARANANATGEVLRRLRAGMALGGLEPLPQIKAFGVGHSMGALMTILQQAESAQYVGVAALGFSTRGLPDFLPPEAKAMDDSSRRRELVRLARGLFRDSYPVLSRNDDRAGLYSGKSAEAPAVEAIKAARDRLLPVPAFLSMLPGNVAAEAARIQVPVFVALGERDLAGPPADAPKAFTGSPAVTFHLLPDAGHSHFLFPARVGLFDALADWAGRIASSRA